MELGLVSVLGVAFILGTVHGITPDEHTWPITFSYSVGSYSRRGGRRVGFLFSLSFTVQRAIFSELAYLALARFLLRPGWQYVVYFVVGTVMMLSGMHIVKTGQHGHVGRLRARIGETGHWWLPLLHGFIAGWGIGAFALTVYTVLAPAMPSAALGFLPGLLFGLGTMVSQIVLGSLFGLWMEKRALPDEAKRFVAQKVSGHTLLGGGVAFVLAGLLGWIFPALASLAVTTPIPVHNLHHLGLGFVLAVVVVFGIAGLSLVRSMHYVREHTV